MNWKCWTITAVFFLTSLMAAFAGHAPLTPAPENKGPQATSDLPDAKLPQGSSGEKAGAATGKIDPQAPWPMFGGTPSRNMVNLVDKNIPTTWNAEEGKFKNIKWVAQLGSHVYGGPVVADGKVFVGTNNTNPRDKKVKGALAILMAFNEADGRFLWQIAHESPPDDLFNESRTYGLFSTPVVEGQRIFYVTPGCVVVCADTTGKIQWTYDMFKELKVIPYHCSNCSPLIAGDLVMVVTGNGVDDEGKVASPKAPSFIAVNKKTGKLAWQSSLPGNNIIEGQWSNPALAVVDGKTQVIFPGGDCVIYGLEPDTGKLIWKCDCNPGRKKPDNRRVDNYIVSTPVVVGDRLYVGLGLYPGHPAPAKQFSYFLCLDITKKGDVSLKSYDVKDVGNKNSALVWLLGGPINPPPARGRHAYFGRTIGTACVYDGFVFITEEIGYLHCLDAKTGKRYWEHDFKASIWASPFYVDGKVYVGTEDGDVFIFAHAKKRKYYADGKVHDAPNEKDKVLPAASVDTVLESTPIVANGVLFIAAKSKLYAIANGK